MNKRQRKKAFKRVLRNLSTEVTYWSEQLFAEMTPKSIDPRQLDRLMDFIPRVSPSGSQDVCNSWLLTYICDS